MVNVAEGLLLMKHGKAGHGREPRCSQSRVVNSIVLMVILISSVMDVGSPSPTWAAVYRCHDAAGKPVLTNRPTYLYSCTLLSGGTASDPTTPQSPTPPVDPDMPALATTPPTLPSGPTDSQAHSMGVPPMSAPLPNPAPLVSPSPAQPCPRGVNPLNPLSAAPCVQAGQSGAPSPGGVPVR